MALKDMMKNAAGAAVSQAQEAMTQTMSGAQSQGAMDVVSGLRGGYTEMSADAAAEQYGMYLMADERFTRCFALLRDKLLFTDRRVIFVDHQGATGTKTSVESISLGSIVSVKLETGGIGFDHATLELSYILTPHAQPLSHQLEFPSGFDIQSLYRLLVGYAQANAERLMGTITIHPSYAHRPVKRRFQAKFGQPRVATPKAGLIESI